MKMEIKDWGPAPQCVWGQVYSRSTFFEDALARLWSWGRLSNVENLNHSTHRPPTVLSISTSHRPKNQAQEWAWEKEKQMWSKNSLAKLQYNPWSPSCHLQPLEHIPPPSILPSIHPFSLPSTLPSIHLPSIRPSIHLCTILQSSSCTLPAVT